MIRKEFKQKDLKDIAGEVIKKAKSSKKDKATILALKGDLGAGKTTLTKEIAKHFKIAKEIISPTFVIMKIYEIKDDKWKKLIHIDAYRLEEEKSLDFMNWTEIISDKDNLIIIEWPEMIEDHIPPDSTTFHLSHKDSETRIIEY